MTILFLMTMVNSEVRVSDGTVPSVGAGYDAARVSDDVPSPDGGNSHHVIRHEPIQSGHVVRRRRRYDWLAFEDMTFFKLKI